MLIDAHAHLDAYGEDEVGDVLSAIAADRILTFAVSVDAASFARAELIASRSRFVVPGYGIHPWNAPESVGNLDEAAEIAMRSPTIGEVGLDHRFVTDDSAHHAQREVFATFLEIAGEQGKLVNVHCPGAESATSQMLRSHRADRVIVHWYSGPLDVLEVMLGHGYLITVGVEVLHSEHIRDVARAIPADQLLTETDNPGGHRWLTGEVGYPSLLKEVVAAVARLREVDRDELVDSVSANMARLVAGDLHLDPWRKLLTVG